MTTSTVAPLRLDAGSPSASSTAYAPPAIEVTGLSHAYDGRPVLEAIDLSIPVGAVVGLVGRNGAGKSTLMRCLVGLTPPDAGHARLLGCPSDALDDATRARLGYVGQDGDLLPWLTVRQHLDLLGRAYPGWDDDRARALCARFGLREAAPAGTLSGGDRQKLALVLALGHDPDLLILDEPMSSLDPVSRRDFLRLLFEDLPGDAGRPQPHTVLLSSHLLSDLERVASHVVALRDGRVIAQGAWDALQDAHGRSLDDLFVAWHA